MDAAVDRRVFLGMAMFRSGRPNLPGTVLGVVLLRTLDNGLNFTDLNDYLQNAISGAAIVLAVLPPALARLSAAMISDPRIRPRQERAGNDETTLQLGSSRDRGNDLAVTAFAGTAGAHRRRCLRPPSRGSDGLPTSPRVPARRRRLRRRRPAASEPVGTDGDPVEAWRSPCCRRTTPPQPAAKEAIDLFEAAAEANGHDATVVDTNSDNAAMNAELTTAVSQGVDAIVVAFGTPQEFGDGLADAAEAGMPVFGLDTGGVVEGSSSTSPPTTASSASRAPRRSSMRSARAAPWR